ncbi:Zn-dependent alcohol dehydrogenase [Novosphingobium sp. PS1R-30]|uniref:Zn-dependent alcohol dehydrogenase n=1 Tax=Novosphingobium anseongense TaxID=3133436 RepID=A0ABU8S2I6_9SPHN
MKAAVLRQIGRLDIENLDLDGPRAGEVRIRVLASGLCHSDYHIIQGDFPARLPAVLGHEAAGVIEAIGADVPGLARGDLVVSCVSAFCGYCHECQTGHTQRCEDKPGKHDRPAGSRITKGDEAIYQLGNLGGFAEEMVVHHRAVVKIAPDMPAAAAALLGCAVLTGVGSVVNGARVAPGSTVVVIGCGGVGLNVVQGARIAGAARIIAVDLSAAKLATARSFGATDTVIGGDDAAAQIVELTGGGADYAFEVVGSEPTAQLALDAIRRGGTVVLVGMARLDGKLSLPITAFMMAEKRVIGSMMGSSPFQILLPQLVEHYRHGRLMLDELVSATIPLEQINEGYARMAQGEVTRSVITF